MRRMVWLPAQETKATEPALVNAIPFGSQNEALVPVPSAELDAPLPAIVTTARSAMLEATVTTPKLEVGGESNLTT